MSYVIFGLNVPLLGVNCTCLVKTIHVWQKSHMFEKNHTCVGKTTVNWYFNEKPNMCGFYQTLTKYKGVWKKTQMFEINQTCVSFSKEVVLLFVFALVFEFFMFDINTLYLYRSFQRRTCNIRRQEHPQNSL